MTFGIGRDNEMLKNLARLATDESGATAIEYGLIPTGIDQYRCAQSRKPMDMIFQGWSMRLFHA